MLFATIKSGLQNHTKHTIIMKIERKCCNFKVKNLRSSEVFVPSFHIYRIFMAASCLSGGSLATSGL